jgi:hypothetical protein
MTAPRCYNREAAGSGPIHKIADQGGLVTKGERVKNPRFGRSTRQERAAESVCFDGDIDDMFAVLEGQQAVVDRMDRRPCAFDNDVNGWVLNERAPVLANVG